MALPSPYQAKEELLSPGYERLQVLHINLCVRNMGQTQSDEDNESLDLLSTWMGIFGPT